jgi:PAS domain S-box-containing protein
MVLLALPALVQLGIVIGLSLLEYRIEVEAGQAERARQIKDCINKLVNERYKAALSSDNRSLIALGLGSPMFGQEQSNLYKQLTTLKALVKDSPTDLAIVVKSERATLQTMAILQQLKEIYDQGNIQERAETKPLVAQLKQATLGVVSPELVDLANHETAIVDEAPNIQRRLHDQTRLLIGLGGTLSVLLTIFAAVYLVRKVALRLEHLLDDTSSLRGQGNLARLDAQTGAAGDKDEEPDELSKLELAFEEMARTINEINAKQIAVVDNSGDMVCTIDENGKITSANAAAGRLFGCHQADLIDKHYRDLIYRKDAEMLSDYLQRARSGSPGKPIQLRCLSGKGRRQLYVSWSAQWTASEGQYFTVVHDLTHIHEAQLMKQEIIAIVSRDLRLPITSLQEFLDLLEEGSIAKLDERGHRFITSAKANTDHMLMLINDMIDLEKAKNGLLSLSTDEFLLDTVIDRAQVVVAPQAEEKDIVLDCRRSGMTIKGEEDKLLRVFTNLLTSAVARAPRETSVLLVSKAQDNFVQVTISDKGPSLTKEQVGTIFDAYSATPEGDRGPDAARQTPGLGLAISKAFVELHGGTISAASRDGEGTTIALTLPLAAISAVQKARVP